MPSHFLGCPVQVGTLYNQPFDIHTYLVLFFVRGVIGVQMKGPGASDAGVPG